MVMKSVQFAKGYVRIRVTGFGLERFLNMAAYHGIYMSNVARTAEGMELDVSIPGFKLLKNCARKTKCRTRIIEKNGLPFILHRYRKRKLLMGGMAFFLLGIIFLSSFVWLIEIEGNESVSSEAVLVFMEEQGLRVGAPKFRLSDRALQQELLNNFAELSWADVYTRGTRTTIRLAEALPPQDVIDRHTPAHVVATAEGVITHVITWSGAPMVRQGDIVQPGELLVSGILELVPDTPDTPMVYVHAQAEVWARRYHTIQFTVPFTYQQKAFTGNTAAGRTIQLLAFGSFSINLPGGGNSFVSYDKTTTYRQPGTNGNYPMPLVLATTHYREFVWQTRTRTLEQAKELADQMITGRIVREFEFGIDIVERQVQFEETEESLVVNALIITHERIDSQVPVS